MTEQNNEGGFQFVGQDDVTFFQDFLAVQQELTALETNARGYGYNYADLVRVWDEGVKPIANKHNFIVFHYPGHGHLNTRVIHKSGRQLPEASIRLETAKAQDIGSEITYYRRYNILCLFNVTVKGEDNDAAQPKKKNYRSAPAGMQGNAPADRAPMPTDEYQQPQNKICDTCQKPHTGQYPTCLDCWKAKNPR